MNGYFVRSTRVTPSVYFNPAKGILDVRGKSSPENALAFYNYVMRSLEFYKNAASSTLVVNMAYEYFNTSSSKCIYSLLKKCDDLANNGNKVVINWYYEEGDEDMREAGEDLSDYFAVTFNFMEVDEIKAIGVSSTANAA